MKIKYLIFLFFIPLLSHAAVAIYYPNNELNLIRHDNFWHLLIGDPIEKSIIPPELSTYEKNDFIESGNYVLVKHLYSNEVLIFSDGSYFGTTWRTGINIHDELSAIAALIHDPSFKENFSKINYQIHRFRVYTDPDLGKSEPLFVYQTPGFRIKADSPAQCSQWLKLISSSGYQGAAFSCLHQTTFLYIPVYSYKVKSSFK